MTDIELDKLEALAKAAAADNTNPDYFAAVQSLDLLHRKCTPEAILSLIASAREFAAEIERLRSELGAAEGRATDYRTVAINQGWNWRLCDAYGREEYAKHRGEHVDACALNAAETRARAAQMDGEE